MTDRFLGEICGVQILNSDSDHPLIQLLIEDDENWFEQNFIIDPYWINDLISVLKSAQNEIMMKREPKA